MGYGMLWGGRDCTYSLSKMDLDAGLANKLDFTIAELKLIEKKSLKSWLEHFKKKYAQVGTLAEFTNFDLSELDNLTDTDEDTAPAAPEPNGEENNIAACTSAEFDATAAESVDAVPDFADVE
eukprot:GEMP01049091.1.p1 GENE.GEMP01049091.1~~GEMP01049091.1.p1  ORF type:complete len:123 (+),score=31.41 GEMP01049091.1:252-620(+)